MKLSLKFREESNHQNPLLRAKIPVTILNLPFLTGIVAGDSSDLSFSLRSNFSTGPSLSLSYHPTLSTPNSSFPPFSVSLKSGIGLFGSPHNSPLTFSANFNLFSSSSNPNSLNPTFSLFIKPHFGNFSLFKSVNSGTSTFVEHDGHLLNGDLGNGSESNFDITNGSETGKKWKSLKREVGKDGVLSGIFVAARTSMPVTKRAVVNFRWGVSFPQESGPKSTMPVLVMNKISLERVEEGKAEEEDMKKRGEEAKAGDLELLKGMCGWMRREVEGLQRENREMKLALESMRLKHIPGSRARGEDREVVGRRMVQSPVGESGSEFDRWRSKKNGGNNAGGSEENGSRDSNKSSSGVSELESELQKAIKAASS